MRSQGPWQDNRRRRWRAPRGHRGASRAVVAPPLRQPARAAAPDSRLVVRVLPTQQLVHHHAERPHVDSRVASVAPPLLRCEIHRRAFDRPPSSASPASPGGELVARRFTGSRPLRRTRGERAQAPWHHQPILGSLASRCGSPRPVHYSCQTEVDHTRPASAAHDDVLGLQVAMHHPPAMGLLQGGSDPQTRSVAPPRYAMALPDALSKGLPLDVLHRQVGMPRSSPAEYTVTMFG